MKRSRSRRRRQYHDNRRNPSQEVGGTPHAALQDGSMPPQAQPHPGAGAMPLTLERRCVRQFPRIALARGRQYFNAGLAASPVWTEKECAVQVRGTGGIYQVIFDFSQITDARRLPGRCDCPAYARGVLCKHLWAAILQIDKTGLGDKVPDSGPLKIIHAVPRPPRAENQLGGPGQGQPQGQGRHGQPRSQPASVSFRPVGPTVSPLPIQAPTKGDANWVERLNQLQGVSTTPATRMISANFSGFFVISALETQASGKLVLDLWTRSRTSNGDYGPLRPNRVSGHDFSQFDDPRDQEVLTLLTRSSDPQVFSPFGRNSGNSSSRFGVDSIFEAHLIPFLASSGKLLISRSPTGTPDSAERPLRMDRGKPWDLELKIESVSSEFYKLNGNLKRDSEVRSLAAPLAILRSGFLLFEEQIGRFSEPRHAPWAASLRSTSGILIPRTQGDALLTRLLLDPSSPTVTWPSDMGWNTLVIEPRPKGVFRPLGNDPSTGRMTLTVSFDYAGREIALSEPERPIVDVAQKCIYSRNLDFEEQMLLRALEVLRDPQGTGSVPLSDLHRAANELCLAGWSVYIENQKLRTPETFAINVSSSTDWFDLKLEASYGETSVTQAALLEALRAKSAVVKLSDGSLGMLPQDWLTRYASVTSMDSAFGETTEDGALRFNRSQGLMLNAILAGDEHVKVDDEFSSFRDKVKKFEGVKTAKAPAGFNGKLRNYQKEGLTWLKFLEEFETGGILADDMGLGKTIQILAFLLSRSKKSKRPSLVIAPKSLTFNWLDEAKRFAPDLRVIQYTGSGRTQRLKEFEEADLVVATYGALRTDVESLKEIEFDVAITDEAQMIKNPKSQAAMACKMIRARLRLALTGTPIENSIHDLLSILEFTNPGLLHLSQQANISANAGEMQEVLARMLKPFMLRRVKEKVLTELPDKSEQVLFCEMSTTERDFYTAVRDQYRASLAEKIEKGGLGRSKLHVLEALLRLRQAACHMGLVDPNRQEEPSAKLQLLLNQLQEVIQEGHKALVFSQFTSLLALVKTKLEQENITYEYLDGQTEDRKTPVERFQSDPKCPVFLVSLKAGGTGLNLTAADYVFILDPWWNPAVEAQAIGRAHRMGQTQKVFAYRMIARGTVEEKILELQKSKKDLAEALISEDKDFMRKLSREDLETLLT